MIVLFAAAAASASASRAAAGDKVPVMLNNNDAIYAEIRDLSIETLGAYLQEKAIHIRERSFLRIFLLMCRSLPEFDDISNPLLCLPFYF